MRYLLVYSWILMGAGLGLIQALPESLPDASVT